MAMDEYEGDEDVESPPVNNEMEQAWRYIKKPLLSIGAKGAKPTQGNSLKSLLKDHHIVKVKVNMKPFGTLSWKES